MLASYVVLVRWQVACCDGWLGEDITKLNQSILDSSRFRLYYCSII